MTRITSISETSDSALVTRQRQRRWVSLCHRHSSGGQCPPESRQRTGVSQSGSCLEGKEMTKGMEPWRSCSHVHTPPTHSQALTYSFTRWIIETNTHKCPHTCTHSFTPRTHENSQTRIYANIHTPSITHTIRAQGLMQAHTHTHPTTPASSPSHRGEA